MRFYIAAYSQPAARRLRDALVGRGHTVTSTWLEEQNYGSTASGRTDADKVRIAVTDLQDVANSEQLILLAEPVGETVPGGKHVETGAALVANKPVHVIGRRENIFHFHPLVTLHQTADDFFNTLDTSYGQQHAQ